MNQTTSDTLSFADLSLLPAVLQAVSKAGYETPSPIQAQIIPLMLAGRDVLGQAQTGTGKTAAFALPILSTINIGEKNPQVLVLAPTRELAIQVAEAFQSYASAIKGFHVLPIYGGQDYSIQLKKLHRGAHVIVGTPGRVMDHMRRGTLKLQQLTTLVLDEADEMLRMGFIDDVEWVLQQLPQQKQIALFSATIPDVIRKIAHKYLSNPAQVTIKITSSNAENIRQRYCLVNGAHKLDALTRILESEDFAGMIIFVRTKTATVDLAQKLEARGYPTCAINGDMSQQLRVAAIANLKRGKLDILVATDVAARGLDVDRVTHVINFDIPHDNESYIHRIGRTGRAGRHGDAILFVSPRERRLLSNIERATGKKVEEMQMPSTENINNARICRFKQRISDVLAGEELSFFSQLVEQYSLEHDTPATDIAAALAKIAQGNTPLLLKEIPKRTPRSYRDEESRSFKHHNKPFKSKDRKNRAISVKMETFRLDVGDSHGVKPANIVGAIANETGITGNNIARIRINQDYSTVELPAGMPKQLLHELKKVRVVGRQLNLSPLHKTLPKKPTRKHKYAAKHSKTTD